MIWCLIFLQPQKKKKKEKVVAGHDQQTRLRKRRGGPDVRDEGLHPKGNNVSATDSSDVGTHPKTFFLKESHIKGKENKDFSFIPSPSKWQRGKKEAEKQPIPPVG